MHIMPTTLLLYPPHPLRIFRPSYGPEPMIDLDFDGCDDDVVGVVCYLSDLLFKQATTLQARSKDGGGLGTRFHFILKLTRTKLARAPQPIAVKAPPRISMIVNKTWLPYLLLHHHYCCSAVVSMHTGRLGVYIWTVSSYLLLYTSE